MYRVRKKNIEMNPAVAITWVTSAAASPFDPEDGEGKQRVCPAQLVDSEHGQQRAGCGEFGDGSGRAPADVGGPDDRVHEQEHPASGQDGSAKVEAGEPPVAPFTGEQPESRAEHEEADRWFDEKHPAPAGSLGQDATEQHPE